jgi:hypothetical protein
MIQSTNNLISTGHAVIAFSALIAADLLFYYQVEIIRNVKIFKENQLLENMQALLIFIAGLSYAQAVLYVRKCHRLLPLGGALLSVSFLLRELDVEKFDVPRWVAFLFGSGIGRNTLLVCLWLMLAVFLVKNHKHCLPVALGLLTHRTGLFAILCGLLLIIGSLFENQVFNVETYQFYEELAEMNGYYFLLLSSLNLYLDLAQRAKPENFIENPAGYPDQISRSGD